MSLKNLFSSCALSSLIVLSFCSPGQAKERANSNKRTLCQEILGDSLLNNCDEVRNPFKFTRKPQPKPQPKSIDSFSLYDHQVLFVCYSTVFTRRSSKCTKKFK
jgi:hypothetical protein